MSLLCYLCIGFHNIIMKDKLHSLTLSEVKEVIDHNKDNASVPHFDGGIVIVPSIFSPFMDLILAGTGPMLIEGARFFVLKKGGGRITINMMEHELHAPMIIFASDGSIIQPMRVEPDTDMVGIVIAEDELSLMFSGNTPSYFCSGQNDFHVSVDEDEIADMDKIISTYWTLCKNPDCSKASKRAMASVIVHLFDDFRSRNERNQASYTSRQHELFCNFIRLVNAHCHEHRDMEFYASKLCLSPRYLGTIIRQESGRCAKDWIDSAVTTKAKVLLRHTNHQVATISDRLGFPNTSFFCKFFKRLTGMKPQEYRATPTAD